MSFNYVDVAAGCLSGVVPGLRLIVLYLTRFLLLWLVGIMKHSKKGCVLVSMTELCVVTAGKMTEFCCRVVTVGKNEVQRVVFPAELVHQLFCF